MNLNGSLKLCWQSPKSIKCMYNVNSGKCMHMHPKPQELPAQFEPRKKVVCWRYDQHQCRIKYREASVKLWPLTATSNLTSLNAKDASRMNKFITRTRINFAAHTHLPTTLSGTPNQVYRWNDTIHPWSIMTSQFMWVSVTLEQVYPQVTTRQAEVYASEAVCPNSHVLNLFNPSQLKL